MKTKTISNVKYIEIEELIEWLQNKSFGYRDLGYNSIDSDELIAELIKNDRRNN